MQFYSSLSRAGSGNRQLESERHNWLPIGIAVAKRLHLGKMAKAMAAGQLSALPVGLGVTSSSGAGSGSSMRACLLPRPVIAPMRITPCAHSRSFLGASEGLLGVAPCVPGRSSHRGIVAVASSEVAAPVAVQQPGEGAKDEVAPVRKGKRIAMFVEPSPFA